MERRAVIPDEFVRIASDLVVCERYPWGRVTFDFLIESVNNAMHKLRQESYSCSGFLPALQYWAMSTIPTLGTAVAKPMACEGPLYLSWTNCRSTSMKKVQEVEYEIVKFDCRVNWCLPLRSGQVVNKYCDEVDDPTAENILRLIDQGYRFCNEDWGVSTQLDSPPVLARPISIVIPQNRNKLRNQARLEEANEEEDEKKNKEEETKRKEKEDQGTIVSLLQKLLLGIQSIDNRLKSVERHIRIQTPHNNPDFSDTRPWKKRQPYSSSNINIQVAFDPDVQDLQVAHDLQKMKEKTEEEADEEKKKAQEDEKEKTDEDDTKQFLILEN
ncbi:PREDICTED: uncharacterized protein LOC104815448 [Tarenaya hassleriana]|uniref:uncharacterized protein LOC104815448 n=1 Tax=Tarenaya hassleriana TaxID=28532 RepID=UPI00053C6B98|nr:PREDICTED: uncharacterized protein LOC104815448 [Tarenaya hassleriana]